MAIAHLDCVSGIAGDMFLGSLVDAGLAPADLAADVASLHVPGLAVSAEPVQRGAVGATQVRVTVHGRPADHHVSPHGPDGLRRLIEASALPPAVRARSVAVLQRLVAAEAKVHRTTPDRVHFHEVGALDTLVDITGVVAGLARLGVQNLTASPVPTGRGTVATAHGPLPVPAPAVAELLSGIPILDPPIEAELTTPTGAALVATLATGFGPRPPMVLRATGYGAGTREIPGVPNVCRLYLGEPVGAPAADGDATDVVTVLETTLDDLTPQACGYLAEACLAAGALDVTLTPVQMKKGRPGVVVQVLARPGQDEALETVLFRESTTFGIRRWTAERRVLAREAVSVETAYGTIRVKLGRRGGVLVRVAPEYDDVRAVAQRTGVAFAAVQAAARDVATAMLAARR